MRSSGRTVVGRESQAYGREMARERDGVRALNLVRGERAQADDCEEVRHPASPVVLRIYPESVTIRVLLAEDNLLVREGIGRLLDRHGDLELIGACQDLDTLLEMVESDRPDVVVTDIRMPPTRTDEGIRAATSLRVTHPEIGVVVLSQYAAPAYAIKLLEGGAAGRSYLLKERVAELDQLPDAVRTVAKGGSVIDAAVVDGLVGSRQGGTRNDLERLTPREREVLAQMAQGKSNAAIADTLYLGNRAVEKHINSILGKLELLEDRDVNRRVKAVLMCLAEADEYPC
jgi:DNA-binding NarL/FixJ family response regulator